MNNPFKDFFNLKKSPEIKSPESDEVVSPAAGRDSRPDIEGSFETLKDQLSFVNPDFHYQYIPTIRALLRTNSSVSLAANSIVELANTGFSMEFEKKVSEAEELKMRAHLEKSFKRWGHGTNGIHGIINKLIYQIYVGGANSVEWVISNDLKSVQRPAVLNPENIRTAFNWRTGEYEFFQQPKAHRKPIDKKYMGKIKLSRLTYQYMGYFNDEEKPVGIPPFLSALDDINSQLKMLKNIGYVSDQLGLMGFLEFLMTKPSPYEGESKGAFRTRLNSLLNTSKESIASGLKDGIVVGFKNDHEFDFHSSTKDTSGVASIFDINHRMVSNGLFTSPQFLGGESGGSETLLTVVFTKMLSQLHNIHLGISEILERGIFLELALAGYSNPEVKITFKQSTITDELKLEQSKEYKIRNLVVLYKQGIISQPQFAKAMGYNQPDQEEPREDPQEVIDGQVAKEKVEKDKDTGDRKTRDKNKPQPKRNDRKSQPR